MTRYDRALRAARTATSTPSDFDRVVASATAARQAEAALPADRRVQARRWLLLSALAWLVPPLVTLRELLALDLEGKWALMVAETLRFLVPASVSVWAAWLASKPGLRPAVLVRAVSVSNMVVARLYALSVARPGAGLRSCSR